MAEITIPEELYRRLSDQAKALDRSVEDFVLSTLRQLAEYGRSSSEGAEPLSGEAWDREWEALKRDAEARASRYPLGFQVDDSRESMYFGRDESGS